MSHEVASRISEVPTLWTLVGRAHEGPSDDMQSARAELLARYGGAAYRYLRGAVRDTNRADELSQEFAVLMLTGAFHRADPAKGRFRDFLKAALWRLVASHRRKEWRWPRALPEDGPGPIDPNDPARLAEAEFLACWKAELLARAWGALAEVGERLDQPFVRILRACGEEPRPTARQQAALLTAELGRPFTEAGVRQLRHRAREHFASALLEAVSQSLNEPTMEELIEELRELDLLVYCEPALELVA